MKGSAVSEESRIVAVNIGNTNLSFALFEGRKMKWARWLPVERTDAAGAAVGRIKDATDVVIASVNPTYTRRLAAACRRLTHRPPVVIGKEIPVPIANLTDQPERVGVDRLLAALAAHQRCQGPAIVVDTGTAISFNLVSKRGEFLGGLIAPGMRMSTLALARYTALLPEVEMALPRGLFGKNTQEAIRAGVYWGAVGMVLVITVRLTKHLGESAAVFITGGSAPLLIPHLPKSFVHAPHLTLEGIACAYEACVR
jgi:type III pantothenate kinase